MSSSGSMSGNAVRGRRSFSEGAMWWQSVLGAGKKGKREVRREGIKIDDLWSLGGFVPGDAAGFDNSFPSPGRLVNNKAANELKLSCTEFDENGKVSLTSGEFKKSELIAKVRSKEDIQHRS